MKGIRREMGRSFSQAMTSTLVAAMTERSLEQPLSSTWRSSAKTWPRTWKAWRAPAWTSGHPPGIHYATTGGGESIDGEDLPEAEPSGVAPQVANRFFEPLPWGITSTEDMEKILRFGHRVRFTAFARQHFELAITGLAETFGIRLPA